MNNAAWVEWMSSMMGGVSRLSHAATFPPDRFYCLLDELPLHLIRRSFRRELQKDEGKDESLRLNPDCWVVSGEEIPGEFCKHDELLSGFARQGTIAWVRDAASGSLLPFWLGPELATWVRKVHEAPRVSASMPADQQRILKAAGILISEGFQADHEGRRREATAQASQSFRERGYAPIADLIHPFHVAALRRYFRHQIRSGAIYLGDHQSSRRYVAHNEPVARFFHEQIRAKLSAIAGVPLKPSYVYFASYLGGAELKKHTDREQCEFSVTLCLDFSRTGACDAVADTP